MKSRVKKHQSLYETLNSDTESTVQNSNLSRFTDRLNEIDKQFEKVNISEPKESVLSHARTERTPVVEDVTEETHENNTVSFDTFENEYLKDFLDEVKAYNVKKGYRNFENTDSNILKELRKESTYSGNLDDKQIEEIIHEVNRSHRSRTSAAVPEEPEVKDDSSSLEETRIFSAEEDQKALESVDETISMAIQDMEVYEPRDLDGTFHEEPWVEDDLPSEKDQPEISVIETNSDREQELLEETRTLQFKMAQQKEEFEYLSEEYTKTGRFLNATIILLILAILVIIMIIVSQII